MNADLLDSKGRLNTYDQSVYYTSDGIDPGSSRLTLATAKPGTQGFYSEHTVNPTLFGKGVMYTDMKFCMREINQVDLRDPYGTSLNSVEVDSLTRQMELAIMPLFSYLKPDKEDEDDDQSGGILGAKYGRRAITLVRWLNIPLGTTVWLNKQSLELLPFKANKAEEGRKSFIEAWNRVLCDHAYNIGLYNPTVSLSTHGCCDSNQLTVGSCMKEAVTIEAFTTITIPEGASQQPIYYVKYDKI